MKLSKVSKDEIRDSLTAIIPLLELDVLEDYAEIKRLALIAEFDPKLGTYDFKFCYEADEDKKFIEI